MGQSGLVTLALWLYSAAPGSLAFAMMIVMRRCGRPILLRNSHIIVLFILILIDASVIGQPPICRLISGGVVLGSVIGLAYYVFETFRLGIEHPGAIRTRLASPISATKNSQNRIRPVLDGMTLLLVAVLEEILFRWYVLFIPIWSNTFVLTTAIVISSLFYGALHHESGLTTMASRSLFGVVLCILTIHFGELQTAIAAHIVYNLTVHLFPVSYLDARTEGGVPDSLKRPDHLPIIRRGDEISAPSADFLNSFRLRSYEYLPRSRRSEAVSMGLGHHRMDQNA